MSFEFWASIFQRVILKLLFFVRLLVSTLSFTQIVIWNEPPEKTTTLFLSILRISVWQILCVFAELYANEQIEMFAVGKSFYVYVHQ